MAEYQSLSSAGAGSLPTLPLPLSPGPSSPTVPTEYKPDFDSIRQQCLHAGILYEDPEFPATDGSLYYSHQPIYKLEWKRPHEIAARSGLRPRLFVNKPHSTYSLQQGTLGDSWVIAATACMSEHSLLFQRLLPAGQGFHSGWYAGMFRFHFWQHGQWREVVVDDRLPTVSDSLVFVQSKEPNEFWGSLLEKAYAKLHGSYEALKASFLSDALHDFTGGLVESYYLHDPAVQLPSDLEHLLIKSLRMQSLVCCWIKPVGEKPMTVLESGLIAGCAYFVTNMKEVTLLTGTEEVPLLLLRLRNPGDTPAVWKGPWGEGSPQWTSITATDRQTMGLTFDHQREFWMDFRDVQQMFNTIDVCNLPPDSPAVTMPNGWNVFTFHGRWKRGVNAGGRPVCLHTHWMNPQYLLTVTDTDKDRVDVETSTCLVELSQRDRRRLKQRGRQFVDIGFVIYRHLPEFPVPLPKRYFQHHTFLARCNYYTNSYQVTKRLCLEPGQYVVLPSTYEPNAEAAFTLRVFFENNNKAQFVDDYVNYVIDQVPSPTDATVKDRQSEFKQYFHDNAGEDLEMDVYHFRELLNKALKSDYDHKDLNVEACKSLVSLVDNDHSGKIGHSEFVYVWNMIRTWKKTFRCFQKPGDCYMDAFDLKPALTSVGLKLNTEILSQLVFRFADDKLRLFRDTFFHCMIKIMTVFSLFRNFSKDGKAVFTLEEWMDSVMVL